MITRLTDAVRPAIPEYSQCMLFGRSAELERIELLLAQARLQRGSTLVIRGEPGIGKSTLLDEAQRGAPDLLVLRTRGINADSELPFGGLFDLLRPLFPAIDEMPAAQSSALKSALGLGPSIPADRFAISTGTLSLLSAAAEKRPTVVIIDDAQWLDQASTECLLFACRRLRLDAIAFLWALREDADRGPEEGEFEELRPASLDHEGALGLVTQKLNRKITAEVLDYLVSATSGNPLTITEAVRAMNNSQLSGREQIPSALPMGVSAVEIFRRRIEAMTPAAVTVLTLLAIDPTGDAPALRRAASLLGAPYRSAVEQLERSALIKIEFGQPTLTHPLVRAAIERCVEPATLRAAHRAFATVLEGRPDPTAWAWHLAAGAAEPDETVAQALDQAALMAKSRNAFSAAAMAFERAADQSVDDEARARRLLSAAEAARQSGRPDDGRRLLDNALSLALTPALKAAIEVEMARADLYHGKAVNARQLLENAAARVQADDSRHAALILGQAACAAVLTGDLVRGAEIARRAKSLLPADDREPIVELGLGYALLHHGDVGRSMAVLLAAADLTWERRAEVDPDFLPFAALALTWVGQYDRARELLAALLPAARAESAFGFLCFVLYSTSYLEARTGHLIAAFALANEGIDVAEATSNNLWRYLSLCCLAFIEAAQGREEECRGHTQLALDIAREQEFAYPPTILDALGLLEFTHGRWDKAIGYLEPVNVRAGTSEPTLGRPTAPDLVEAYIRAGRQLSPSIVEQLNAASRDERFPALAAAAKRCLGLVASELDMVELFGDALRLQESVNNPFAMARTELCFGERLRRAGRRRDARDHLERAHALFRDLGAAQWAERVNVELQAAGGRTQRAATEGLGGLTAQELQVAITVGRGRTNREAAAELFVSPKTIEFHLSQIYRKLGVHSRSELAVEVARVQRHEPGQVQNA